ncbi:protein GOLVEN 3-like [Raphanus sativus]|uniref:Protein GOLVEN 3-like n=1 Tax=Raphanus sativus TaxID=3726 RepID=A0A6J0JT23_RAPSA|nr:protein GOLVEN 3-like [Raphanus sativus]
MMRFTIIVVAFLIIIQALEDDHILVYAHEGGDAGHKKSLDYFGDKYTSTLHPKDSHDFTNSGAPRKLRSGRTMRTTVARDEKEKVRAMNNDDWSIKISSGASKHLMVERKIGFHKRREHKKIKIFGDFDTTKHIDDLTTANSLPKRELFFSEDMKKLARLLRSDYPIHSKPRGKLPVHNRAPDKI